MLVNMFVKITEFKKDRRTRVRAQGPARHDVGGAESRLFNFSELIAHILIQDDAAEGSVGEIIRGQGLGRIEDVDRVSLGNLGTDDLAVDIPRRELASLDVLVEGTGHEVGVGGSTLTGLG